jgi:hypothetical protein
MPNANEITHLGMLPRYFQGVDSSGALIDVESISATGARTFNEPVTLSDTLAGTTSSMTSHILGGLTGNTAKLTAYQATVTVANGATTGKEAAIGMSANFLPIAMLIHCTVAATNACSLVDVGDDADTDSYCDGIVTNDLTSTGFKGIVGCNGVRALGDITGGVQVATTTADEVEIVVSADPGATGVTLRLTFIGITAT